jgi:hypothetical protein
MATWAAVASAVVLAMVTRTKQAWASPSAKLTYARSSGAERCPDEADLRKAVAARLGYHPFFPSASTTVVAEITRAGRGFHGHVKILDEDGVVRGER